jgi:hypothetical protein
MAVKATSHNRFFKAKITPEIAGSLQHDDYYSLHALVWEL